MSPIFQTSRAYLMLSAGVAALLSMAPGVARAQVGNTATGTNALVSNTTGNYNTATGFNALFSNTSGSSNTGHGYGALFSNTSGIYNTATGTTALYFNTTGISNTATGNAALYSNTTGSFNSAFGGATLRFNTTGSYNVALGNNSLFSNTTGSYNTAAGLQALRLNTSGYFNTAIGNSALDANSTGSSNTAVGYRALAGNTAGSSNIAVGENAGTSITTGNYNIDIGNTGSAGDSGTIRIGTVGSQTQAFIAGISGVTASGGVGVFINASGQLGTLTSSKRFKKDIQAIDSLSDKLLQLRPVAFRYKQAVEDGVQYGLIAEEVAEVFPELVQYDAEGKPFTVYYHLLTPLMVNELQKEHRQNLAQQAELAGFQQKDAARQAEIASLRQQLVAQQQQQQQQAAELAALQLKLSQLDRLIQASYPEFRLSQK